MPITEEKVKNGVSKLIEWKLKLFRVGGYISLVNMVFLVFIFSNQLYEALGGLGLSLKWFIVLLYFAIAVLLLLMAEIDWRMLYKTEQGLAQSKNPLGITECFRSAYLLSEAKRKGYDISKPLEMLREAFKDSGYQEEFEYFWSIFGGEKDGKNRL